MEIKASELARERLEGQADCIERVLLQLSMPVRVSGGQIGEGWIRYHVTPVSGTKARQVRDAASRIARTMGVSEVRVAEQEGGLAVDVPFSSEPHLRLLPLLRALGPLPPLTAVGGMVESGHPVLVRLDSEDTWNLHVSGPAGSGKSELLRSFVISLALTSRPSQMQLLGIDIGGRELAVFESLPHLLTDVATDQGNALEILAWSAEEVARRRSVGMARPHLVLVVDDLGWLAGPDCAQGLGHLESLWQRGPEAGFHVFAARRSEQATSFPRLPGGRRTIRANAVHIDGKVKYRPEEVGRFRFRSLGDSATVRIACLTARDLDKAVRRIAGVSFLGKNPDIPQHDGAFEAAE